MDCQPIKFYDSDGRLSTAVVFTGSAFDFVVNPTGALVAIDPGRSILTTAHVDGTTVGSSDRLIICNDDGALVVSDSYIVTEQDAHPITRHLSKPNRWRRFWHWALLGWRWVDGAGWVMEQ